MSDLMCPAIIVLATRDTAATVGAHVAATFTFTTPDSATLRREIDALADLHRGETICVIAPAPPLRELLGLDRDPAAPVTMAIDSDGWTLRDQ